MTVPTNLDEEIKALREEIAKLEERRRIQRKPLEQFQVFVMPLDVDRLEKFRPQLNQLADTENSLNLAVQKLVTLELQAIRASSTTLEGLTRRLANLTQILIAATVVIVIVSFADLLVRIYFHV